MTEPITDMEQYIDALLECVVSSDWNCCLSHLRETGREDEMYGLFNKLTYPKEESKLLREQIKQQILGNEDKMYGLSIKADILDALYVKYPDKPIFDTISQLEARVNELLQDNDHLRSSYEVVVEQLTSEVKELKAHIKELKEQLETERQRKMWWVIEYQKLKEEIDNDHKPARENAYKKIGKLVYENQKNKEIVERVVNWTPKERNLKLLKYEFLRESQ